MTTGLSHHGNANEIIGAFGGADQLRNAVSKLRTLLYATWTREPTESSYHETPRANL